MTPLRVRQTIRLSTLCCLLSTVDSALLAQPEPDLVKLVTFPESDEVVSRKDQSRMKGRIRSVNEANINFKQLGKLPRLLSNDDYAIVTWFGVTNAQPVSQVAAEKVALTDRLLQQLSTGDGVEAELIEQIQLAHQQMTELRDSITRFENRQAINGLPLSMRLAEEHVRILLNPDKGVPRRIAIEDRLKKAGDVRKNVISLRKRLSVIEVELGTRRFSDVQRDSLVLSKDTLSREAELREQRASTEGYQSFRSAVELLSEIAGALAGSQPLLTRQPTSASVDQDIATMNEVIRLADAQLAELPILGKSVIEPLSAEFQLYREQIKRFTRYRELTNELRSAMNIFNSLTTRTNAQGTVNEVQLTAQLEAQAARLKSLVTALKTQQPADLSAAASREAEEFIKRSQESSALLMMRKVDIPRITLELRALPEVRTRTAAQVMLAELERRVQRLQQSLDQNRLTSPSDQADCRNMLQIVKANMEHLTGRMLEFDLNETRDEFTKQTALMDDFLKNAKEIELALLINRMQQSEKAIGQIEKGYRERIQDVSNPAAESEAFLRNLSSSKEQMTKVIDFLRLRQELGGIDEMPEDITRLKESQERLSALKASILESEPKLPASLGLIHQATVDEVARLELNLRRTFATLRFHDSEQAIVDILSQSKAALEKRDVPAAGTHVYLATSQSESLETFLQKDDWLAQQSGYFERIADLKAAVMPLRDRVAMIRDEERLAAGWEPWLGNHDLLLSPSPDVEWFQIESLLSQQEWDAFERKLDAFAKRYNEPNWSSRISQKRAELQLLRGRAYEQQGQLDDARAAYLRTIESSLKHPVVKAAEAAILNVDEQLRHTQSVDQFRLSIIATGVLLIAAVMAMGTILWQRTAKARLRYAARCLQRARGARSAERRDALVREAAYVLAQFSPDDRRVAALWITPTFRESVESTSKIVTPNTLVTAPPSVELADVVDAALVSQAAPELIAAQCLEWLKSKDALSRRQKRRNREVREWLLNHLEPREYDSTGILEAKVSLLLEYEAAINPREAWTKRYRLLACYQLGRLSDALEAAKSMSRERLPAPQLEEWARLTASCYLQSEQWSAAENFLKSLTKRKLEIEELPEWLLAARAGLAK